jgi:hypothetical protein
MTDAVFTPVLTDSSAGRIPSILHNICSQNCAVGGPSDIGRWMSRGVGQLALNAGMPTMANCRRCGFRSTTREHIWKALAITFNGEKYIKLANLEQFFTTAVVQELLCHTQDLSKAEEGLKSPNATNQIEEILRRALRLLALCVCADVPLSTFNALFDHGFRDEHLPLQKDFTHPNITPASVEFLLQTQSCVIPHTISDDGAHHHLPAEMPIPIMFEEVNDRVGRGSFSEVFRVEADVETNRVCQVRLPPILGFHVSDLQASEVYHFRAETV